MVGIQLLFGKIIKLLLWTTLVMSPLMFAVFSPNILYFLVFSRKKSQSKIWSIFPDSQCTRVDTGYDVTSQIFHSIHKHKHTLIPCLNSKMELIMKIMDNLMSADDRAMTACHSNKYVRGEATPACYQPSSLIT